MRRAPGFAIQRGESSAAHKIERMGAMTAPLLRASGDGERRLPDGGQHFPALVLNADFRPLSYFPLSVWAWQDAIKAVFLDRVSVLSEYEKRVHSPSVTMRLPSVIALKDCKAIAFASSSSYRDRDCYAGIAEFSVYVARQERGNIAHSRGSREPLRRLHSPQAVTTFSHVVRPPRLRGTR